MAQPKSTEVWQVLQSAWNNLPARRYRGNTGAFLKANGGHTKYRTDLGFCPCTVVYTLKLCIIYIHVYYSS